MIAGNWQEVTIEPPSTNVRDNEGVATRTLMDSAVCSRLYLIQDNLVLVSSIVLYVQIWYLTRFDLMVKNFATLHHDMNELVELFGQAQVAIGLDSQRLTNTKFTRHQYIRYKCS